jgi:hypothetical protein
MAGSFHPSSALPPPHLSPLGALFVNYIRFLLGGLPPDVENSLVELAPRLQRRFKTEAGHWKGVVEEALHLSPTIEVAIFDAWYATLDAERARKTRLTVLDFARRFVDHYLAPHSRLDTWTPDVLAQARARIAERQAR